MLVAALLALGLASPSGAASAFIDAGAPPDSPLSVFAWTSKRVRLVPGRDRVAVLANEVAWLSMKDGKLVDEPATARSLEAHGKKFDGDSVTYLWGRTPLAANGDAKKPQVARAGAARAVAAPGVVQSVVQLSESSEVWAFSVGMSTQLAVADAKGRLKRIAPLAPVGPTVSGVRPGLCEVPTVWRLAPSPDGVAAFVVECHRDAPLRQVTVRVDGTTSVRKLDPLGPLDVEPNQAAVAPDGTTLLAGRSSGKLVVARAGADGHWALTKTGIPNVEAQAIVVSAGALWTLCLGQGPDGKDAWTLARDGVRVELRDPEGKALVPVELAIDASLGVVVRAFERTGTFEHKTWLFAERPPAGPVRELP